MQGHGITVSLLFDSTLEWVHVGRDKFLKKSEAFATGKPYPYGNGLLIEVILILKILNELLQPPI
jgi:hypothetical protein